jgi:signal transduction histidine kinase
VGDTVLGVFDVQANTVNYFTDEEVRIQSTLAAQIAVALNNANLYADQSATVARLRELDHLKSSFLANMSHELRTPLNSILGFTEVILEELDGPLTEQMESDLQIVYKNGQHLLHLINDVLDMAKIESGKLTLHPERLDLIEVLEEVIGLTSPLANTKDIELRLDTEFGTLEVEVDRIRIRQVMINIINNAIKFTEQGHIDIRAVPHNDLIRISVKDTGFGIPPNHLESVFQEFTQVDTTTTRKAGGTGLGLPISRHLVEMHGGKLWAESTGIAGEGSTFFVELPVTAAYAAPPMIDR